MSEDVSERTIEHYFRRRAALIESSRCRCQPTSCPRSFLFHSHKGVPRLACVSLCDINSPKMPIFIENSPKRETLLPIPLSSCSQGKLWSLNRSPTFRSVAEV